MKTDIRLDSLVASLLDSLDTHLESERSTRVLDTAAIQDAFYRFGADAARLEFTLGEAMAGGVTALRSILAITGALGETQETLTAGLAFAAASDGFHSDGDTLGTRAASALGDMSQGDLQIERMRALHKISKAATTSPRPQELLEGCVRSIARATRSDACAVFLYNEATDTLSLWGAVGLNPASIGALSIRPGEGITGLAAQERHPIVAADAQQHPAWRRAQHFGDSVYASQASIPMMIEAPSKLVGVLNIHSASRRELSEDDVAFLRTVANELAIGVEFARLRNQTDARLQRKIDELGTLQRVSRSVASSLSLSNVLKLIAEAAAELTNAEAAALFRLAPPGSTSDDAATPVIEYRVGRTKRPTEEDRRDSIVQLVIESGEARSIELEYLDGLSRLYCLPLRSARERWGALCVRLAPGKELGEDELALLQAFTDSASIAIENAELYRDARSGAETASALLQEMHHRVRNNLQTLAALLSLQIRTVEDAATVRQLREATGRIQAIASVHDLLSDEQHFRGATVDAIARTVAEQASVTLRPHDVHVTFDIPPSDVVVSSRQATVLALIINELLANAMTHGFAGRNEGHVRIVAVAESGNALLRVTNDGQRISEEFAAATSRGLGLRIVDRLAQSDLRGAFTIGPGLGGTVAEITFPLLERPAPIRHYE
jgi:two-component system, sensor histidine kinase PdtaS